MPDRRLKEALARARAALRLEIDALQPGLAGQVLDGPDGDPAKRRIVR
jgi:hypothetical protein